MSSNEDEIPHVPLGLFNQFYTNGLEEDNPSGKVGEELSPDAIIWKICVNQAEGHDYQLVQTQNSSLDMLLLFATLFSAIVTAFLIESKKLLEQDSAQESLSLLLFIAQSQHRVESGQPTPNLDTPTIPEFKAPTTARWVNGFWFTSLALSISTALIAMLGKEWLGAFLASRSRQAYTRVLNRQARLEGLNRWWALHIIALLPSVLHVALLLFSVGLVIYLWALDNAVAIALVVIVGVTAFFYVATALLGAVYEFCPFITELSGYIRKGYIALTGLKLTRRDSGPRNSSLKDVQALLWLAEHTLDPIDVDSSYQALAGLYRRIKTRVAGMDTLDASTITDFNTEHSFPTKINSHVTSDSLLVTLFDRFKRLTNGSLDNISNPTMSAARYIDAILGVLAYTGHTKPVLIGIASNAPHVGFDFSAVATTPHISAFDLLESIETLWSKDGLVIEPNGYASILVATMDIILPISFNSQNKLHTANRSTTGNTPPSGLEDSGHDETHIVDIAQIDSSSQPAPNLKWQELGSYYSRWLLRVSYLLQLHSDRQELVAIKSAHIEELLEAIKNVACCDSLNPVDGISTHLPSNHNPGPRQYTYVIEDKYRGYPSEIRPDDLHKGPLGALVRLLWMRPSLKDGSSFQVCLAALQAYAALAPILLQQVLGFDRGELVESFKIKLWPRVSKTGMQELRYIAARQALLTARYIALAQNHTSSLFDFCRNVLGLLSFCIEQDGTNRLTGGSHFAVARHSGDLVPLLEFAAEKEENYRMLSDDSKSALLTVARTRITRGGLTPCDNSLTPDCFPLLIRLIGDCYIEEKQAERLVQAMVRRIRAAKSSTNRRLYIPWNKIPAIEYLRSFTHSKSGFQALERTISHQLYRKVIAQAVVDLVHLAAGQDPALAIESVGLSLEVVPDFLNVLKSTISYFWEEEYSEKILSQMADDVLILLAATVTDSNAKLSVSRDPAYGRFVRKLIYLNTYSDRELPRELKLKVWSTLNDIVGFELGDFEEDEWYKKGWGRSPPAVNAGNVEAPIQSNFEPPVHTVQGYPYGGYSRPYDSRGHYHTRRAGSPNVTRGR